MPQKPVSEIEQSLIDEIRETGHHKNYELIEYVNDVNREYTEVLMEANIDGAMDTAYTYGNERIALERFTGWTGYYTYDPRGSVSGVTDSEGKLWKSYRYGPTGDITFGKPEYNNSYTYNAEDYNPNLEVQYLRARYYDVERGNFLTEDPYLGSLTDPLSLNRYNYVKSSAPNYVDPSGYAAIYYLDGFGYMYIPGNKLRGTATAAFGFLPFGDLAFGYILDKTEAAQMNRFGISEFEVIEMSSLADDFLTAVSIGTTAISTGESIVKGELSKFGKLTSKVSSWLTYYSIFQEYTSVAYH